MSLKFGERPTSLGHLDKVYSVSPRNYLVAITGIVSMFLALGWPLEDLATHYLLIARLFQNVLLVLIGPGLFLLGFPRWIFEIDSTYNKILRKFEGLVTPVVAIVVFNVVQIGSLAPDVVSLSASNLWIESLDRLALVTSGFVLWIPALGLTRQSAPISPGGKAGYLFIQSLIPNFLSLVYIFARHPFYRTYIRGAHSLSLSPLFDQQMAGVLAKVAGIFIIWGSALYILFRKSNQDRLTGSVLTIDDI